jgi:hypothetical protein
LKTLAVNPAMGIFTVHPGNSDVQKFKNRWSRTETSGQDFWYLSVRELTWVLTNEKTIWKKTNIPSKWSNSVSLRGTRKQNVAGNCKFFSTAKVKISNMKGQDKSTDWIKRSDHEKSSKPSWWDKILTQKKWRITVGLELEE